MINITFKVTVGLLATFGCYILFQNKLIANNVFAGQTEEINQNNNEVSEQTNGESEIDVVNFNRPISPNPVHVPGWYFVPGFITQPMKEYNVHLKNDFQITAKVGLNNTASSGFGGNYFSWFVSSDGVNWDKVSQNKHSRDTIDTSVLTDSSDTEGVRYYQAYSEVQPQVFNKPIYSEIATVHFIKGDVNATEIKVNTSKDYLVSNPNFDQYISASAITQPKGATGRVIWSSSDTNLATVDPYTGKITANPNRKTGTVKINAEIINPRYMRNSNVFGYKELQVKKMLEIDGETNFQNTVLFRLNPDFDLSKSKIEWFQKLDNQVHKFTNISDQIISKEIKLQDNNSEIYAVITPLDIDDKPLPNNATESNHVKIQVKDMPPGANRNVHIRQSLSNISIYGNSENIGVHQLLKHKITFNDDSETYGYNDDNVDGNLRIPISINETNIKIESIPSGYVPDYRIENDGLHQDIIFENFPIKRHFGFDLIVSTRVDKIIDSSFDYNPVYKYRTLFNTDETVIGKPVHAEFSTNTIEINPKDINFGEHSKLEKDDVNREQDLDNEKFVDIRDKRIKYSPISLFVSSSGFQRKGAPVRNVPITLANYDENGIEISPKGNYFEVASSMNNSPLKSVFWNRKQGLKLKFNKLNFPDGDYHTTLYWTLEDSINSQTK
ncbi:hypothetical protein [Companilactobacillus ginsenosidimutans]|uniref:BIG2 domain-containing protein n=1 Tax=Companilactobacillus ginsenosidimutans TaxID=1007676 RepID=A0A0H4QFZ7_9LACO|nr:hypothetical protein [Companilactobacillus ginsenosidimutans]AKP67344.1 hypothetical protein ABM34_07185 [Companilactobacillus ginsenosidimutans]